MTAELDKLKERLGAVSTPIEYRIDAGSIQFFADSIMDPDPRYHCSQSNPSREPPCLVAPPTFFGSASGLRGVAAGDPATMSSLNLPFPRGWMTIATGDGFEFYEPIRSGMTLISRERLVDVREKLGRSGRLIFYTIEKVFSNPAGAPVLKRVLYCAAREPNLVTVGGRPGDSQSPGPVLTCGGMPTLTIGPVTVRYLAMFATATAEFVDIHYDADFARSVGLPGPIIQGLYKTALVARMLKDWLGDGSLIRCLNVEHRGMDLAGAVLTVGGAAAHRQIDPSTRCVDCRVWVRNQHGIVTTSGSARVVPPIANSTDSIHHRHQ
jgi:acyl dehydratase